MDIMPVELVSPLDEIFYVGSVGMVAVMLTLGELAIQQADINGGHFLGLVVVGHTQVFCSQ